MTDLTGLRHARSTTKGRAAQKRVIEEALILFQEQGYQATSIREIADAAGLAKATVYHHFPTKGAILYEIHNVFMKTLEDGMTRIAPSDLGPAEQLRAVIHELWRVMVTHRPHVQLFFEEWRHLDEEHLAALRLRRDSYFAFVRGTVADTLAHAGSSADSAHIDVLTLAVFGMCNWGYQWFAPGGPLQASEIADTYAELVLAAFSEGALGA